MPRSLLALIPIALIIPLIAACESTFDDHVEEYGSAVEQQLARVEQIGALMARQGPLAGDTEGPRDETSRIRLDERARITSGGYRRTRNAGLMYTEAFADLTRHGHVPHRINGSNPLNSCASLIRTRTCPTGSGFGECSCSRRDVERQLAACAALRYLFVIRTIEYAAPQIGETVAQPDAAVPAGRTPDASAPHPDAGAPNVSDAGAARDMAGAKDAGSKDAGAKDAGARTWQFAGGRLAGEVHVFDLKGPRRLGGFRFEARSSPSVRTRALASSGTSLRARLLGAMLDQDLARQIRTTIRSRLRQRIAPPVD